MAYLHWWLGLYFNWTELVYLFWIQHKSNPNNFLKMTIKKYFWKKVRDFYTKQLPEKKVILLQRNNLSERGEKSQRVSPPFLKTLHLQCLWSFFSGPNSRGMKIKTTAKSLGGDIQGNKMQCLFSSQCFT